MAESVEPALRLKALRERSRISIREMAKRLDMSTSGYLHYESPARFKGPYLPLHIAEMVADAMSPEGVERADVLQLAGVGVDDRPSRGDGDHDLVAVYDVEASAGGGVTVYDENAVAQLAFPPGYLSALTRAKPSDLAIISVKGDSMVPTLAEDDVVMIDLTKRDLSFDGVFVIRDGGSSLLVKRIGRASKAGLIALISDNRTIYPTVERDIRELEVVGRVIWRGGRL